MQVWIYSPYAAISEGLQLLVTELGFEASTEPTVDSEVALWDLTHANPPFPTPASVPTLAMIEGEERAIDLLHRGYHGYLSPAEGRDVLSRALRALRRGEIWAERRMLTQTIQSFTQPKLTSREEEIYARISKGWSNRAIAKELKITERTVKAHASRLYEKLGVSSRVELIVNTQDNNIHGNGDSLFDITQAIAGD